MIFDAIVVGLGAVGSATLYQLSKQTTNVLGIDQYAPPHPFGSTHSDSRITRQAIGEGTYFVPLALRSYAIWRELEQRSGESLLTITGGLFIGKEQSDVQTHNKPGWLATTIQAAESFGIAHQILAGDTLRKRFPQFRFQPDDVGYFEEQAGFLRPEKCVAVQLSEAQKNGATVRLNEPMLSFDTYQDVVTIRTNQATYQTRKLIITTGAWLAESLRSTPWENLLTVCRQVQYWFEIRENATLYSSATMPVYIFTDRDLYGFPDIDGATGALKMATEQYVQTTSPNNVVRTVSDEEIQKMYERYVAPNFVGVGPSCLKTTTCLYTMTPNGDFLIDQHPNHPNVLIASACSGHGFKHSAAVGQILAELTLEGQTEFDIQPFRLQQFSPFIS